MFKGFVLFGDKIMYGGVVIFVFFIMIVNGKFVVLVGDKVSCLILGYGINVIIEGLLEWFFDGKVIVVDGCKC